MVLFGRGPRNRHRELKTISALCVFVYSIFGRVDSLVWSIQRIGSKSTGMAGGYGGIRKTKSTVRQCGKGDDFERNLEADYKYAYVHPSIRNVLVMDPPDIDPYFLEWENTTESDSDMIMVNGDSLTIRWDVLEKFLEHETSKSKTQEMQNVVSMEQLVTLASQCDAVLFHDSNKESLSMIPSPIRGLLRILPKEARNDLRHLAGEEEGAHILIASLLALNMVENSIRNLIGKKNGKAPLLKDMIEIIASREGERVLPNAMVPVLRTLLLPKGLNLRNLVWHGFLPTIPRRWLSLSIVLTLSIDKLAGSSSFGTSSSGGNSKLNSDMRKHKALVSVLDHGRRLLESSGDLDALKQRVIRSNIIPKSHKDLFEFSLKFVHHHVVFASVMAPLIEHLLRLMWCHENEQEKQMAQPGSYYVTLDGHGQKDKHEIVVMPFLSQQSDTEGVRNQLVYRLGGPTMAFLMDMFTSPSGGPNIRATVAHGSFNAYLFEELGAIERETGIVEMKTDELTDVTSALLVVLSVLCEDGRCTAGDTDVADIPNGKSILRFYQPCFSYSASLFAEIRNMMNSMESLYGLISGGQHLEYARNAPQQSRKQIEVTQKLASITPGFETVVNMQEKICLRLGKSANEFTDENFFQESSNNSIVSECGAAILLLSEIAEAASSSLRDLEEGIEALQDAQGELSSRKRKQVARVCASAQLTLDFYLFAAYCALLFIERRQDTASMDIHSVSGNDPTNDEIFMTVKRSRMVVSTFSTTKTFDRALSALSQYLAGKAIKSVSQSLCNSSIH